MKHLKRYLKKILILSITIPYSSYAQEEVSWAQKYLKNVEFGAGLYLDRPFSTEKSGGSSDLTTPTLKLSINGYFNHQNKWYFLPEFDYIPFFGLDTYSKTVTRLSLIGAYRWHEKSKVRFGVSLERTTISGDGGTISLGNGTTNSNYYLPKDANEAYVKTIDIGADYDITTNFSLRNDWNIANFFSEDKRSVSTSLTLHYHL